MRTAGLALALLTGFAFTQVMAAGTGTGFDVPEADPVSAQQLEPATALAVSCDGAHLLPGVPCEMTLQAEGLAAIQYAGLELRYDPARLTFLQERPGSVFGEDAVVFARQLPNGRLGVSVSSTAGEREGDGGIIHLDFVIRDGAPHGEAVFAVEVMEITDRDGIALPAPLPGPASFTIPPYLTDAGITDPGTVTIARGSELVFRFRLAASGISAGDIEEWLDGNGQLTAEMVIIDTGTWDGSAPLPDPLPYDRIVPLSFTGTTSGQFRFEAPFPVDQPVGTWLVAGRFQFNDHPVLTAGYSSDGGGTFDGAMFTAVPVTVTTPRVTVAGWTFDGEQWTADTGLYLNLQPDNPAEVSLFGARFSGWTTGSSGRAPNSNNWQQENGGDSNGTGENGDNGGGNDNGDNGENGDNGGGDGGTDSNGGSDGNGDSDGNGNNGPAAPHDKYWQARLATSGYGELTLQFQMNGSGTGPRDFRLYYSTDGEEDGESDVWQPVPGGDFQGGTSWALHSFTLPGEVADVPELILRWVRIGNTSISGNEIGPTGTNRIDEIRITGVPLDTDEIFVWPGSTSGAGTVTEADVLNLGLYWMSTGPERVPRSIAWAPQPVVRWAPESAAHADTDGDGRVDYRDLLAIGRNFGETVGSEPVQQKIAEAGTGAGAGTSTGADADANAHPAPLVEKTLPVLEAGESVRLVLHSGAPIPLTGLSTRFSLDYIPPDAWELETSTPADWADEWEASGQLIRFHHGRPHTSHSNPAHPKLSSTNVSFDKEQTTGSGSGSTRTSGSMSGNTWSAAWVHTGSVQPVQAKELAVVVIRAVSGWQASPQLRLHRASLSTPEGVRDAETSEWSLVRQELPVDAGRDGSDDSDGLPKATRLYASYPNPFNPTTTLSFDLHESGTAHMAVYDAIGRHVATLVDEHREAGRHQVTWNASLYASGMYIVRLETAHTAQSRRVMLVK